MARKNPFEHVMSEQSVVSGVVKTNFKACGASKSISSTLDDLADKADKLLALSPQTPYSPTRRNRTDLL